MRMRTLTSTRPDAQPQPIEYWHALIDSEPIRESRQYLRQIASAIPKTTDKVREEVMLAQRDLQRVFTNHHRPQSESYWSARSHLHNAVEHAAS